jgi:hypothetical protein
MNLGEVGLLPPQLLLETYMKLQLDTEKKTIKLEQTVKLSDLVETLEKLLPDGQWKEFKLETNTVIRDWNTPIIIRERTYPTYPTYPWYSTMKSQAINFKAESAHALKAGTYNIES